jgi:hypothetical protein
MISNTGTEKYTFKRPTPSWGRKGMVQNVQGAGWWEQQLDEAEQGEI